MADATERFYTRAAERAARKLVGAHRAQERKDAAIDAEIERRRAAKAREAAEAAERERPSGLDPGFRRMEQEQRKQNNRTRKQPRTPRGYG